MHFGISPFSDDCADGIANWPCDADEARAWAGKATTFPLDPDQFRCWHQDADVHSFVGRHQGDLVAYGELWLDQVEHEAELARIIVHPSHRGIGVGRSFVKSLVWHAATFGFENVLLRVLPVNANAIRCYEAAGFVRVPTEDQETFNQGQPCAYVWLEYFV